MVLKWSQAYFVACGGQLSKIKVLKIVQEKAKKIVESATGSGGAKAF